MTSKSETTIHRRRIKVEDVYVFEIEYVRGSFVGMIVAISEDGHSITVRHKHTSTSKEVDTVFHRSHIYSIRDC